MREGSPPVAAAVAAFLADLELAGRSPATLSSYRSYLRVLDDWPDEARLRELVLERLRVNPRTAYAVHAVLSSFYAWCERQGYGASPMRGIPRPKQKPPEHRYLTKPEIARVWAACQDDDQRRIVRLLLLGLRARELLALEAGDINGHELRLRVTKGGAPRRVWLDDATLALVAGRSGRLVPGTYAALRQRIERLGRRAKLSKLTPHDFRRTWASQAFLAGANITTIQQLGGWRNAKMPAYYARSALQEAALADAERMNLTGKLLD